jgi:hypothetical protein
LDLSYRRLHLRRSKEQYFFTFIVIGHKINVFWQNAWSIENVFTNNYPTLQFKLSSPTNMNNIRSKKENYIIQQYHGKDMLYVTWLTLHYTRSTHWGWFAIVLADCRSHRANQFSFLLLILFMFVGELNLNSVILLNNVNYAIHKNNSLIPLNFLIGYSESASSYLIAPSTFFISFSHWSSNLFVLKVLILSLSTTFILHFGTVLTVWWYFSFFCSYQIRRCRFRITN